MEIRSRLVTTDNPTNLPVAIAASGAKQIGVAVIVSDFANDTVCDVGQACINLLGRTANRHGLFGDMLKVELATEAGATARIEMTLASSDDGDVIVFMCADSAIFDITWRSLNVRAWP